ncbi:hypothetical protein SVIOM74S_07461 [Streptomyces violarus]
MTGRDGSGDAGRAVGRRSRALRIAGFSLAGALVLGIGAAGWAYRHLSDNITSVDIDNALGDNRPPKPEVTPSSSAAALPSEALNILVLGSDSRSGEETAGSAAATAPVRAPTRRWSSTSTPGAPARRW